MSSQPNPLQVIQKIVVRTDLNMRKGKLAAQVAHVSNTPIVELYRLVTQVALMQRGSVNTQKDEFTRNLEKTCNEARSLMEAWWESGHTKIVLGCASEEELCGLIARAEGAGVPCFPVTDLGLTEFHGVPTLTCCGLGPFWREEIDKLTADFKLI